MSIFNKILLLLVIATQLPQGVYAQNEQLKDTLDWRGYYPLEIGNVWEWKTHILDVWFGGDFFGFDHREIVSDTMINDQKYFVQAASLVSEFEVNEERKVLVWREYLRYDTLQTRVVQFNLDQREELGYTCDLSADFNSIATCFESIDMWAAGDYASEEDFQVTVGSEYASYNAMKGYVGLSGGSNFLHGIGRLPVFGDGSAGTIDFSYVKVGNNEYGERSILVSIEGTVKHERPVIEIYPNPVKSQLYIVGPKGLQGIKVIDILGRSAPLIPICEEKKCQLDVSSLTAGIYVLEYSGAGQVYGSQTFVIAK